MDNNNEDRPDPIDGAMDQDSLSRCRLREENACHAAGGGISANNRAAGFLPAFQDQSTGLTVVSRFANGQCAPVHVLDGLPASWVSSRDGQGKVQRARPSVVAGFLLNGVFYTREAAAAALGRDPEAALD